ncbi:unnamed protein product [Adineta steineri]|uniref:AIG1-type G domain-containing protein n=1 Tax=Adineta steineri TaxID=433720 RepID=A0A815KL41_9BILA|nr:unnamed protein product [Adineta steineri]CAF3966427.1 unnamed protein product [Adineta steineri]
MGVVGKSALGNLLIGTKEFAEGFTQAAVTKEGLMKQRLFGQRTLKVVDTPGFFDPVVDPRIIKSEIRKSLGLVAPGPHAFLVVLKADRLTPEERACAQKIREIVGPEAINYCILIITHSDYFRAHGTTFEEYNSSGDRFLPEILIKQNFGGRYMVVNSKEADTSTNQRFIKDLIEMITSMVGKNNGKYFENEYVIKAPRIEEKHETMANIKIVEEGRSVLITTNSAVTNPEENRLTTIEQKSAPNLKTTRDRSRKAKKIMNLSKMKDDMDRSSRGRSASTESSDFYYGLDLEDSKLEHVDVAITTEPKEKKPYPVLWLERSENVVTDHHTTSEQKLRDNKFILETFTDNTLCEDYLQSDTSGKCFLIVDDSWGRKFLEQQIETGKRKVQLHDHPKLAAIYVYTDKSDDKIVHDTLPALKDETVIDTAHIRIHKTEPSISMEPSSDVNDVGIYPLVPGSNVIRGSFINMEDLLAQMCEDQIVVKEKIDNLLKLSVIKHDEASVESASTGNFIWFQIFIEALRRMDDDRDAAKEELLYLCRLVYKDDKPTIRALNDFEANYTAKNAIRWYTESTCFFRLINKALRFTIYDTIIAFRLLINDICVQLQNEHEKERAEVTSGFATPTIRIYRGQWMRMQEFKDLSNSINNLVLVKSFFSATRERDTAESFVVGGEINEKETPLLMIIDADKRRVTGAYADVSELSVFERESEIIFTPGSIFRIKNIYKDECDAFHIMEVELCSQDDNELKDTYNYIKDGLAAQINFTGLGDVLFQMNEFGPSEKCHKRALQTGQTNDLEKLRSMAGLAHVSSQFGYHEKALRIHKQVFAKQIQHLSPNDKLIGISHVNIGIEYYNLKKLDEALFHYEKARQIFNECYPANHPVYCQFTNNVAVVYAAKVQYDKAKSHLQTAERILKATSVPESHPDTATILGNIGAVYSQLKDADNAMNFQQRAFDIRQRSLPSEHLDMALSNHNLAIIHESRNDYQLALLYYKEALRIKLSCLTKKSPEYLQTWEYYKDLCQKIQDSNTMGIIIVGPSKSGKSSFGNILAGADHFQVHRRDATSECTFCYRDSSDKHLILIDTPPIFVDYTEEHLTNAIQEQIKKCNAVLESHLRAILIVISSDSQSDATDINLFFQQLNKHFGEETVKQKCVLILTHLDLITAEDGRTIADHLLRNPHLEEWIQRCNGYYFDGSKPQAGVDVTKRNKDLVAEIIEKIRMLRTFE